MEKQVLAQKHASETCTCFGENLGLGSRFGAGMVAGNDTVIMVLNNNGGLGRWFGAGVMAGNHTVIVILRGNGSLGGNGITSSQGQKCQGQQRFFQHGEGHLSNYRVNLSRFIFS